MHFAIQRSLFLLALIGCNAVAATRPLGIVSPYGESTIAYDVNAAGQVAAVLEDEEGRHRGVMFEKGVLTELGSPGGMYSDARAINPSGEIVGSARNKDGSWNAFLFDRARGLRTLGTLGGPSSYGMTINEAGHAAGFADTASGEWHAFLYTGGDTLTDLGTLGGTVSYAAGMNNVGQVVGTAALATGYRRAFIYDATNGMRDLGTLGGRSSSASAINDAGMVVGASETKDRRWRAFAHDGKRMIDLGALIGYGNSFATDINNSGHVVGTVLTMDERLSFVWRDGKMTVHRGGHGLHLTNSINDKEQVIGATYDRKLTAATMVSDMKPVITRGGSELLTLISAVIILGLSAALYHQRKRAVAQRKFPAAV
ncbi:MAG: HAF repeat-containing protein [Telluria sp.]|nr:HAF repeat-containing protein [Telluria sp.]